MYKTALTIAGSDSGGGAGIQADLKTFHNYGVFGSSAITALTAQNTQGVQGIYDVTPEFLELQIRSVLSDIGADAVKTGMLSNAALIRVTASMLREFQITNIVVDPVMISKSGHKLLKDSAIKTLIEKLLPLAMVVTPNLDEAEVIIKESIQSGEDMKKAARKILSLGPRSVLIKGGHLKSETAVDYLYDGKEFLRLESPHFDTKHTHGTGCTLSSAIAACLALGFDLKKSIDVAKKYIAAAIEKSGPLGQGIGPVNHLAFRESPGIKSLM